MNGFKKDYLLNDNSFIRRENCERFLLYCDLIDNTRAIEHCVTFSGQLGHCCPPPAKSEGARTPMYI